MKLSEFVSIENDLASSETPALDLSQATTEVMSHYLRAWRGRPELARAFVPPSSTPTSEGSDELVSVLNRIRLALRSAELEKARSLMEDYEPENELEQVELGLEGCRYHLFRKNYAEVIRRVGILLSIPSCPPQSRLSLLQVRGIAHTYSSEPERAIDDLETAIALGACLPSAPSAFAAYTVLSQTYSRLGNREKAHELLRIAKSLLDRSVDDDVWIERLVNFQRGRVRFAQCFETRQEYRRLAAETEMLADWLGLRVVARLCRDDLSGTEEIPRVSYSFLGGRYLPGLKLALLDHPRRIARLENSPQSSRILELLCQRDQRPDELFQTVWGYRFQEATHAPHLRTMLSKLRKKIGDDLIVTDSGWIRLRK